MIAGHRYQNVFIFIIFGAGTEGRRGPKGEPGKGGEKGDPGSFDFLMLMVSDLRHDLERLKARTFPNEGSSSVAESRVESTPTVSIKFSQLVCMCRIIHSLDV